MKNILILLAVVSLQMGTVSTVFAAHENTDEQKALDLGADIMVDRMFLGQKKINLKKAEESAKTSEDRAEIKKLKTEIRELEDNLKDRRVELRELSAAHARASENSTQVGAGKKSAACPLCAEFTEEKSGVTGLPVKALNAGGGSL